MNKLNIDQVKKKKYDYFSKWNPIWNEHMNKISDISKYDLNIETEVKVEVELWDKIFTYVSSKIYSSL